jgi:two-component system heavy metal sensor histidine kinase CusS
LKTLTAQLVLLFSTVTLLTFAIVGSYLYQSLRTQLERRDDHELVGKIEQFRHIMSESDSTRAVISDRHRLLDAAAGHDGLIVVLKSSDGRVIMSNIDGAVDAPALSTISPDQAPQPTALGMWEYTPGRSARAISALARVGTSSEVVQILVGRTSSDRMVLLREYLEDVIAAMLIGVLLAAGLGYVVVRRAVHPIKRIATRAHSITAQRLDTRLDASAVPVELQALVQAFNEALDRLQDSFQRLSRFSADLAHDLRTPIYNLTMQTQVALSQPRSGEEYQALLSSGLEEYERLTRMVESMLFLARADNAEVAIRKEFMDAGAELQKIADYFEGIAADAGVILRVEGSARLQADPALFRRAVSNLVANAVRYTPQGQTIRLHVVGHPGVTVVNVINPGAGIDSHHLPRLFDRFYRADPARCRSASSTGLGLAIVQTIMKLHGGTAEVASVRHHETTFSLRFPVSEDQVLASGSSRPAIAK